MATLTPQKRQCKFASVSPAATLNASGQQHSKNTTKDRAAKTQKHFVNQKKSSIFAENKKL